MSWLPFTLAIEVTCGQVAKIYCRPNKLEVFIEHIPRAGRQDACSAATIDVTSLPMRGRLPRVRVWPYPRCGSDRLPYIQHYYTVKLERWGQMLRIIGNSWKKQPKQ